MSVTENTFPGLDNSAARVAAAVEQEQGSSGQYKRRGSGRHRPDPIRGCSGSTCPGTCRRCPLRTSSCRGSGRGRDDRRLCIPRAFILAG